MGTILQVYVDDDTAYRLGLIAAETGRATEELAECSVAEAALDYFRRGRGPIPKAPTAEVYRGPAWDDPAAEHNARHRDNY